MRITRIVEKDGRSITPGNLTVLVGPNNVGKSQALRDIHTKMTSGKDARTVLIQEVHLDKPPTFEALVAGLQKAPSSHHPKIYDFRGIGSDLRSSNIFSNDYESYEQKFNQATDGNFTLGNLSKLRVAYLDAGSRLLVAAKASSIDFHEEHPQNLLQLLYTAPPDAAEKLSKAFQSIFDVDIRLDYSGLKSLRLRVAQKFPAIPEDTKKACPIFNTIAALDDQGDGYKSCAGVILSLLLCKNRIILLDEPEAFLHPAQAKMLGFWIASQPIENNSQLIIATHNASFLTGVLAGCPNASVFRLNRTDNNTSFNPIPPDATSSLVKSPLLSSQRVMEAVFYRGVVVCEADADRAVYQTVADKICDNQEVLFIHAHNKQTIKDIVSLLRTATIPACAITDLDILDSTDELQALLAAIGATPLSPDELQTIEHLRAAIGLQEEITVLANLKSSVKELHDQLDRNEHNLSGARGAINRLKKTYSSQWSTIKAGGINAIPDDVRPAIVELLDSLLKKRICIVPVGELEGWIDCGTSRKNEWVVRALTKLHNKECPQALKEFVDKVLNAVAPYALTPS